MGQINLTSITWDFPPETPKRVIVSYRLTAAPDIPSSYVIVTTSAFVDAAGFFMDPPLVIPDLDITQSYTVKVVSTCGGFSAQKEFVYVPDGFAFSLGFSLGFDA